MPNQVEDDATPEPGDRGLGRRGFLRTLTLGAIAAGSVPALASVTTAGDSAAARAARSTALPRRVAPQLRGQVDRARHAEADAGPTAPPPPADPARVARAPGHAGADPTRPAARIPAQRSAPEAPRALGTTTAGPVTAVPVTAVPATAAPITVAPGAAVAGAAATTTTTTTAATTTTGGGYGTGAAPAGSAPVLRPSTGQPAAPPLDTAATLHLLRRTTYGITPELLADVADAGGAGSWLAAQLAPATLPDAVCDAALTRFPLRAITPQACWTTLRNGDWKAMYDVCWATLARQLWSKRQLFEVMVEFWSNHLNITCPSSDTWASRAAYDNDVIRANALGRFDDMLVASMQAPAMLYYLNNAQSNGAAPNENYGRELLELHTVGVDAGYGQDGVVNAARALTGLTVWDWGSGVTPRNRGTFRYRSDWRATGTVRVLGWSHPNTDRNGGVAVATSLGRYLANHPATAARIATKLVTRFVSDTPPPALVARLAQVYLDNGTAVVPVLQALFASPEFAASAGQKYRRPAEDVLASYRAVGMVPDPADPSPVTVQNIYWQLLDLGHAPLGWHPPNGYPDVAPAWCGAGTTLARWNLHMAATEQWWKRGVTYPDLRTRLVGPAVPATRAQLVAALTGALLPGQVVAPAHAAALVTFLGGTGPVRSWDVTGGTFAVLVGLVLDSPYWSVR